VFSINLEFRTTDKVHKAGDSAVRHRQKPIVSVGYLEQAEAFRRFNPRDSDPYLGIVTESIEMLIQERILSSGEDHAKADNTSLTDSPFFTSPYPTVTTMTAYVTRDLLFLFRSPRINSGDGGPKPQLKRKAQVHDTKDSAAFKIQKDKEECSAS
jgi:hypothetical protein